MKTLRVYQTHMDLSPYTLGEYPKLERLCSTDFDYIDHKLNQVPQPIGYLYNEDTATISIPRGIGVNYIANTIECNVMYEQPTIPVNMKYRYRVLTKPRNEDQVKVVGFLLSKGEFIKHARNTQLCLNVEPGFGKTFCAVAAAIFRGKRTVVICHTTKIYNQWKEALLKHTDVPEERIAEPKQSAGLEALIAKKVDYDFILVLHASLNAYARKHGQEALREWMDKIEAGTKIIDEVHLFFKDTIQLDLNSNVAVNYYLTATMGRSNRVEERLYTRFFREAAKFGTELGITKNVVYTFVHYTSNPSLKSQFSVQTKKYGINMYRFIDYALKIDEAGSLIVVFFDILQEALSHGGKVLALFPKIDNLTMFRDLIKGEYPDKKVGLYYSKQTDEENENATLGSLGTGADIDGLQSLIVAGVLFSSKVVSIQLPKRLRPLPNGECSYCYELVDCGFPALLDMEKRKVKHVKEVAKEIRYKNY